MRWWDVDAVAVLERECFGAEPWSRESFLSELAQVGSRSYLCADLPSGDLAGYAGCCVVGSDADVQTLAVAASARGSGLGRRLLDHLVQVAAGCGARRLHLEVRADNVPAIGLYRSAGFEEVGRRRGYYRSEVVGAPAGDALLMRLALSGSVPLDRSGGTR